MGRWKHLALAWGVLLCAGPPSLAQEDFEKLSKAFSEAQQKWYEQLEATKQPDGRYDMSKAPPDPTGEFVPRFKALVEQAHDKSEALKSLLWIVQNVRGGSPGGDNHAEWAIKRIAKDFAGSPDLKEAMGALQYAAWSVDEKVLNDLYEQIVSRNPEKSVVARALFNQAYMIYSKAEGDDAKRKPALDLFRRISTEYKGEKAAELAAAYIFELENLQVGMKAPDFVGEDVNGKEIRLSQFRGQVVVIDFWGFW